MQRTRVIIIATLIALMGAIGSIALAFHLSSTRAINAEEEHLQFLSQRGLERTRLTFSGASAALHQFEHLHVTPCSEEHILQMRKLTIATRSIADIGYVDNGVLKCTAGGMANIPSPEVPIDFMTEDGIAVSLGVTPKISDGKSMAALYYKSHVALIDSGQFTDLILDPDVQLAVATSNGKLLGTLHDPDQKLVEAILTIPDTKGSQAQNQAHTGGHLFGLSRQAGLVAVVIEPYSNVAGQLQRERMIFLPIGLLVAALIVGIVVWIARRRLSPLGELKIGVERREFVVHYQPIIALSTGMCVGAEALVRWPQSDGSMIGPDLFIPLAEENALILPITDQVVAAVVCDMHNMLRSNPDLHIAINVSAQDMATGRILDVLDGALRDSGILPQQIWLEVTERSFMDIKSALDMISHARDLGYVVVIDDFGTGYSSLAYLQGFPLDVLKIDKSFIDTIGSDSATSSVMTHIIDMAKTLHLNIVAEGIETQVQADYLVAREVQYGQGWLFAKAMPAKEFLDFYNGNTEKSTLFAAPVEVLIDA
ncbi:EAL domain-containing protein [Glaciimonas sp. GG7]